MSCMYASKHIMLDIKVLYFNGKSIYNIAHDEQLQNGQTFSMAAEVGLLTRNVKIYGTLLTNDPLSNEFGGRVLVGKSLDGFDPVTGTKTESIGNLWIYIYFKTLLLYQRLYKLIKIRRLCQVG